MPRRAAALLACLLTSACAVWQPFVPDSARLPPSTFGAYGVLDPDVRAVHQAQWAFADPGRTQGRPIEAIRAAASIDYIAGQFYVSPRWASISALTKQMLLEGRGEVREALGVRPDTSSQELVNRLAYAGNALEEGNTNAAESALGGPVFAQPGNATLQRLANLPYLQAANVSTMRAANELFRPNNLLNF